jgi:hypothetical protein
MLIRREVVGAERAAVKSGTGRSRLAISCGNSYKGVEVGIKAFNALKTILSEFNRGEFLSAK